MKHQETLDLMKSFPRKQYPKMTKNQKEAVKTIENLIADGNDQIILELPTGTGKTAVGYAFLKAHEKLGLGPLFYICPNKSLVDQVNKMHPDLKIVYGRNEYDCLYYPNEKLKADEIPCSLLIDCPYRVDQETGKTYELGAVSCPYFLDKYQAKQGGIVVCTTAFYLFTQSYSKEWGQPAALVIDEAHRLASTVRGVLSYEITDYHLKKSVELLAEIGADESKMLNDFLKAMIRIIRIRPATTPTLLEAHEIRELIDILLKINSKELEKKVKEALRARIIDPTEKRETLKRLEIVIRDLYRHISYFEYSLPTEKRYPLNYTYAYYKKELEKKEKIQYRLFVKAYRVGPLISGTKHFRGILGRRTLAYSATIGDPKILKFETGIDGPFYTFSSDFPVDNSRIFLPTDTPNLAVKARKSNDLHRCIKQIVHACGQFAKRDIKSLVIVISNKEREKFMTLCKEKGVNVISYGGGIKPKDAVLRFKEGEGDVLVGTAANYAEGVDLPKQIAPVIFFLRPGYPNPKNPGTIFEERRYGSSRWEIWNWRVMIEALQVRGRNIRSIDDLGVCFFMSQQFRRFLLSSLPEWLKGAYRWDMTLDQCAKDTLKLLAK